MKQYDEIKNCELVRTIISLPKTPKNKGLMIILNSDNRFYRSTFTSILSIIISLMYIPLKLALPLKLIWTSVALITCGIFSFIIMPYSIVKESIINMGLYQKLNNKLWEII